MKTIRSVLAANLVKYRGTRSQLEIAKKAKVSELTLRRAEQGKTIPNAENLSAIAKALGVYPETKLVFDEDLAPSRLLFELLASLSVDELAACVRLLARAGAVKSAVLDKLLKSDDLPEDDG